MDSSHNVTIFCSQENTFNISDAVTAEKWLWSYTDVTILSQIIPVLSFVGIAGNGAFLFTILRLRHMKNSLSFYLFNLGMCDIFFLIMVNYWYISNYLHTPVSYRTIAVDSTLGCISWVISTHVWYFAGIELTTVITVERYLAVCVPLRHRVMVGKKRTFKILAFVWFAAVSVAVTIVPQYSMFTSYCLVWPNQKKFQHMPSVHTLCNAVNRYFLAFGELMHLMVYLFALICNIVLYAKIILALSRRQVCNVKYTKGRNSGSAKELEQTVVIRNQVAKTLVIIGIIFFLCQTPYRILSLDYLLNRYTDYKFLDIRQHNLLKNIAYGCYVLNSVINPYLYVGSCKYYRDAMKDAFCVWSER